MSVIVRTNRYYKISPTGYLVSSMFLLQVIILRKLQVIKKKNFFNLSISINIHQRQNLSWRKIMSPMLLYLIGRSDCASCVVITIKNTCKLPDPEVGYSQLGVTTCT